MTLAWLGFLTIGSFLVLILMARAGARGSGAARWRAGSATSNRQCNPPAGPARSTNPHSTSPTARGFLHVRISYASTGNPSTLWTFKPRNHDLKRGHSFIAMAVGHTSQFTIAEFLGIAYEVRVNRTIDHLLRLFALVWLALGMGIPVSAWTVHNAAHGAAQVSADEYHHHEDDGGISVHEHDDGETPDGGHDHMPSILLGAVTVPQAEVSLIEPTVVRQIYTMPPSRGVERHASDGLRRPPRLG